VKAGHAPPRNGTAVPGIPPGDGLSNGAGARDSSAGGTWQNIKIEHNRAMNLQPSPDRCPASATGRELLANSVTLTPA
jgi:hypothetical protein